MAAEPTNQEEWNKFLQKNPNSAWGWAHRGEYYLQKGKYHEALNDLNQALGLEPDYLWAIARRGEVFRLQGDYSKALKDFDHALQLSPDYVWGLAHRGATLFHLRWLEEALQSINRALKLNPNYAWALAYRTEIHIVLKQYEASLQDFDHVLALDKTVYPKHWQGERAMVLNFLGRYTEAIEVCQEALDQAPDDYYALYSKTVAEYYHYGSDKTMQRLEATQHTLQNYPNASESWAILYRLGGISALLGHHDMALEYLQKAGSLHPEPLETARHDPVWQNLRQHPSFQKMITNQFGQSALL